MKFLLDFLHKKTRVPGLSYGIVFVILGLAVCVELLTCDRQTDGQTDKQTYDDSIYRTSIVTRSKNWMIFHETLT